MKFISNAELNEPVENGRVFRAKTNNLEIYVHRLSDYEGWYMTCPQLGMHNRPLNSLGLLAAIKEAQIELKKKVEKIHADIAEAMQETIEISRY